MTQENKRLLVAIDTAIRDINRRIINPELQEVTLAQLHPVIEMVAKARAKYLRTLFDIAGRAAGEPPDDEDIARLAVLRGHFEELVKASQALETAIEREYLDVRKP